MPALLLPLVLLIAGCALTPEVPPLPERPAPLVAPPRTEAPAPEPWWRAFDDPVLERLILEGLREQPALAARRERLTDAQRLLAEARAERLPLLEVSASQRQTDDGRTRSEARLSARLLPDLWGAQRAAVFTARARLEAERAECEALVWRTSQLIAQAAHQWALDERRLALARQAVALTRAQQTRIERRHAAGLASGLDAALAATAVANAEAREARARLARDRAAHALALLLGSTPGAGEAPAVSPTGPGAAPGLALSRLETARPDLRAAAARIEAASGSVAVARSRWLPDGALRADALLSGAATQGFSLGAELVQAVFDGGRRRAGIAAAEAEQRALLEDYRGLWLAALGEIADALRAVEARAAEHAARAQALQAAEQALALSQRRYEAGLIDALTLLSTQAAWIEAQDGAAETLGAWWDARLALAAASAGDTGMAPLAACREAPPAPSGPAETARFAAPSPP